LRRPGIEHFNVIDNPVAASQHTAARGIAHGLVHDSKDEP
jgi:hypothetical protein